MLAFNLLVNFISWLIFEWSSHPTDETICGKQLKTKTSGKDGFKWCPQMKMRLARPFVLRDRVEKRKQYDSLNEENDLFAIIGSSTIGLKSVWIRLFYETEMSKRIIRYVVLCPGIELCPRRRKLRLRRRTKKLQDKSNFTGSPQTLPNSDLCTV